MSKTVGNTPARILRLFAWTLMLLASDLPEVIWYSFFAEIPDWAWIKIGVLVVGLALCWFWPPLHPLRAYVGIFFVFKLADIALKWVGAQSWWQSRFAGPQVTFFTGFLGVYILDVGLALVVLAALWLIWRKRSAFFLVKGQLDAPIEPVRWLGIGAGESWRTFGWIFAGVAALAIGIPLFLGMQLTPGSLGRVLPLLPAAVLFAAINACNEEIYFRTSFLSTLHAVIGKPHTLLISCVFFGLGHYLYGAARLHRRVAARLPRMADRKKYARNQRLRLAVVHPLCAGCGGLCFVCPGVGAVMKGNW